MNMDGKDFFSKYGIVFSLLTILGISIILIGCERRIIEDNGQPYEYCDEVTSIDENGCKCVEISSMITPSWVCNEKVLCGDKISPLYDYIIDNCDCIVPEMPDTTLEDGDLLCGSENLNPTISGYPDEEFLNVNPEGNRVSYTAKFHTDACQHNYTYDRSDNHIRITQNLQLDTCVDLFKYSGVSGTIRNLEKGDYKISIYSKYDKSLFGENTNPVELLTKDFEIK
jgi:hypothetical protein